MKKMLLVLAILPGLALASAAQSISLPEFVRPAQEEKDKEAEELKKAIEFYNKFPPPDWGPIRHTLNLQKQARGQTLTPLEREFEAGYPALWEKGRDASQKN